MAGTYDDGYQESDYAPTQFTPQKWVGELDKSVSHTRRVIYLRPYYALVVDTLDGTGNHTYEAHWQIGPTSINGTDPMPPGQVDSSTQAYFSNRGNYVNIALFPLERDHLTVNVVVGQKGPILGWAQKEGKAFPSPTVCFIKQQDAPATFATLLYPYQKSSIPTVTGQPISTDADAWGQSIVTPQEKAEVVLIKDGTCKPISFQSALTGTAVNAQAAGILLRQPSGQSAPFVVGWDVRNYNDGAGISFTRDQNPLFFNAGSDPVVINLTRPTAAKITLAPQAWTDSSGNPAQAPALFPPLIPGRNR